MAASPEEGLRTARRSAALLAGLALGLAGAVVYLVLTRVPVDRRAQLALALDSPEVKRAAIAELVAEGGGVWDTYPDPDVGRVMQPNVPERDFRGELVSSNELGMRERPYAVEKPAGTTRIVLLGDSFVYGYKVKAEDRLGVFLEQYLREKSGRAGDAIECLHLAASSWNLRAECAYLRRQLAALRPDLVVQVTVANDLDDLKGARGFGGMGFFSPQVPGRVNGLLSELSSPDLWPGRVHTYLNYGVDDESRRRYAEVGADVARLASAVQAAGGRYLLVGNWETFNPMVAKHVAAGLAEDQTAYVPSTFTGDARFRIDDEDRHWNRAGHERIAKLLYGLIQRRGLLPGLALPAWDEAEAEVAAIQAPGRAEAQHVAEYEAALILKAREQIAPVFDVRELTQKSVKQVHGGIDAQGNVAPYAALVLARGGERLLLAGRRLDAPGLAGATCEVFAEEVSLGTFPLAGAEPVELAWPLPPAVQGRAFLSVRFVSSDYVYTDVTRGRAGTFVLERAAIE
jgi:lysophospholipase L1-like esterase